MRNINLIVTINDELCSDFIFFTSKSKNTYNLLFNFISPWEKDIVLQAVFKPPYCPPVIVDLDIDNSCVVPAEVLQKPGRLGLGLRGIKRLDVPENEEEDVTGNYSIIHNTPLLPVPVVKGAF